MSKTAYCWYWEEEFKLISKCWSGQYSAFCKVCNKPFNISGNGIGQVKYHHWSKKHLEWLDKLENDKRGTFTSGKNGQMTLTKSKWSLMEKEKILNAEILQVLQSYKKVSCILKFSTADHLKKQLIYDVKCVPYNFKFDETTTIQTKK